MARAEAKKARTEELEREYVVPLRASQFRPSRRRRAGHASSTIRQFIARHMHGTVDQVWLDPRLNEHLWERGVQHIPRNVRVKAIRFEDGLIEVDLIDAT
jgi:large subunit ribosomal protein L31e